MNVDFFCYSITIFKKIQHHTYQVSCTYRLYAGTQGEVAYKPKDQQLCSSILISQVFNLHTKHVLLCTSANGIMIMYGVYMVYIQY